MRVLRGDQEALELWSKTRAWVISGQRKTLARLGVRLRQGDLRVRLPARGRRADQPAASREGTLTSRYGDDMVMYETEREELEEMPLVRSDGLPTQHMRALAYWAAAPELDDFISLQVCGNEWVAHVTCRRQLIDALGRRRTATATANANGRRPADPRRLPRHGRPRPRIDHLQQGRGAADRRPRRVAGAASSRPTRSGPRCARDHPQPERLPARIALAYFLLQPTSKRVEFEPEKLLREREGQPRLGPGAGPGAPGDRPARGRRRGRRPRLPLRGRPVGALPPPPAQRGRGPRRGPAGPLRSPTSPAGTATDERSPEVERVARTVLDQGVRGLGLEAA